MGGDDAGLAAAVDVIVASRLERFHQRALAAVAQRHDGKIGVFGIGADDARDFERAHLAHVGGAENGARGVVFKGRKCESCLRAGGYFKTFTLQGVAKALGKIHVAVDQENLDGAGGGDHGLASASLPRGDWLARWL